MIDYNPFEHGFTVDDYLLLTKLKPDRGVIK